MSHFSKPGPAESIPLYNNYNESTPYSAPAPTYNMNTAYNPGDYACQTPSTEKHHHQTHITYVPEENSSTQSVQRLKRKKTGNTSLFKGEYKVSNFRLPRFAAPWQHKEIEGGASSTVREFEPDKQWRRVLINGIIQWFFTLIIVAIMVCVLLGFGNMRTISKSEKYMFNALNTGLSLVLGLVLVKGLKSYVKLLSWRFLAAKYRNLQDFQLVMNCDSQWTVTRLIWTARTEGKWWLNRTQALCLLSLFVFIGLQVDIALLGFAFSVDISEDTYDFVRGNVSVANLGNITQYGSNPKYNNLIQFQAGSANVYGTMGQNTSPIIVPIGDVQAGKLNALYVDPNTAELYYRFNDKCSTLGCKAWNPSKRTVSVEVNCERMALLDGGYSGNTSFTYVDEREVEQNLWFPGVVELTTTFIGNISESPCGPRCTSLLVMNVGQIRAWGNTKPSLYACNSTMKDVVGLESYENHEEYKMSDTTARLYAGAAGWSGDTQPHSSLQYRTYTIGSPWSWDGDDQNFGFNHSYGVELVVGGFALTAISAVDNIAPRLNVTGFAPVPAQTLTVKWMWVGVILGLVPAVQLVSLVAVVIWANGAVIKDSDPLSTARLLRPVVEKLDQHGCALTADEIARTLGNYKIVYGARQAGAKDWHLGLIEEDEGFGEKAEEGWCPGRKFPPGRYDGIGYADENDTASSADDASEKDMLLSS